MYRSNTYNLISTHRDLPQTSPSKSTHKRVKSLQKIKINRKGLPRDFFRAQTSSEITRPEQKKLQMATFSIEFEETRTTPKFLHHQTLETSLKRQSKSEERRLKPTKEIKPYSPFIKMRSEITFSKPFFTNEPKRCPKIIDIKIKKDKQIQAKDSKYYKMLENINKNELTDIIKRKKIEKQTYCYHLCPRTDHKRPNKLPILKEKYPAAFGV